MPRQAKVTKAVRSSTLCAAVGVAPSTLAYWVRVGVVHPSEVGSAGHRYERWWSITDVVAVRTVKALRDSGCPLQTVRKAIKLLGQIEAPLSSTRLVWDGSDVFLVDETGTLMSAFQQPGQEVLQATVLPLGSWEQQTSGLTEEISVRRERRRRSESRSRRTVTTSLSGS